MRTPHHTRIQVLCTGGFPVTFTGRLLAQHQIDADSRGVALSLYETVGHELVAKLEYITNEPGELGATYSSKFSPPRKATGPGAENEWPFGSVSPYDGRMSQLECVMEWVKEVAPNILPPGAGHPVSPLWEVAQKRLAGVLHSAALHCLTHVLKQSAPQTSEPKQELKAEAEPRRGHKKKAVSRLKER